MGNNFITDMFNTNVLTDRLDGEAIPDTTPETAPDIEPKADLRHMQKQMMSCLVDIKKKQQIALYIQIGFVVVFVLTLLKD